MRRWYMCFGVMLVSAGLAAAADNAEAVIKKAIDSHGGADALNKYKGGKFKMKGDLSVLGMDLEFTGHCLYSIPDRFKMEIDFDIMGMKGSVQQIVKGEKTKNVVTIAGMSMAIDDPDEKDELKLAAAMQEAEQITPLLDKKKFTIKSADDEEVNTKKASVVIVTPAAVKKDVKFYFDKDTGLLIKTSHKGRGPGDGGANVDVQEDSYLSDYKKVNGVQVAMKMEVKHDDKKFMNITLSDYELVEKIDDKEFAIDD